MPSAAKGVALAKALGVDPGWLFDDKEGWPPPEPVQVGLDHENVNQLLHTLFNGFAYLLAVASEYREPDSHLAKGKAGQLNSFEEFKKQVDLIAEGLNKRKKKTKKRRSNGGTGKRA
ncbi:MAG: hypothetical protein MI923_20520 [Phycisphaerales bacterium]|nr:hypothetical protein [Phycisphaerales bacterium]